VVYPEENDLFLAKHVARKQYLARHGHSTRTEGLFGLAIAIASTATATATSSREIRCSLVH
jgi:hypothetical protein